MQISLRTDRSLLRADAQSVRYLLVSLSAPSAQPRATHLPVHVALVLDRSGSMDEAGKFDLARLAVEKSLTMLRPDDLFTLVVYDTEVDVLVGTTRATPEAKHLAMQRLRDVGPRGGTDLAAGWHIASRQLVNYVKENAVSRVLLLTDGLANHGVTRVDELTEIARQLREQQIATSTFGVGADFDERLLRDIAHEGAGNFYYIQSPPQITDVLTGELGEALEVVVRDAQLQLALPAGVQAEPLNRFRYQFAAGDNELIVSVGDLVSEQQLELVIKLRFPRGDEDNVARLRAMAGAASAIRSLAESSVEWQYATHEANDRQPRDRIVDRAVAHLYAARARATATECNRHGDYDGARRVLEATSNRIRGYAAGDPELERLWRDLRAEIGHFVREPMSAMDLKAALFTAEAAVKGRAPGGRARRGRA